MNTYLILLAAVLPAVVLMYYIWHKDKEHPEPTNLLMKGFGYGVLSVFLSLLVSIPLGELGLYSDAVTTWEGAISMSFFGAAIPEELAKLFMLWILLRKNPYFDEHVDGIVYAVSVSMGFAALENIAYLFSNYESWQSVGVVRALVSVPGHYVFAVFMGYYYSLYRFGSADDKTYYGIMAVAAPILLHGVFDMLLFMSPISEGVAPVVLILFCVFCSYMHKYAARRIKEHLEADSKREVKW